MRRQELAELALRAKRSYVGITDEEACAAVEALVHCIEELESAKKYEWAHVFGGQLCPNTENYCRTMRNRHGDKLYRRSVSYWEEVE